MVGYRRNKPGSAEYEFFITIVTHKRKQWFASKQDCELVHTFMGRISQRFGLKYIAWAILPEHLHWVILPGDADYSKIVYSFKGG